jgi:hypothetical protein
MLERSLLITHIWKIVTIAIATIAKFRRKIVAKYKLAVSVSNPNDIHGLVGSVPKTMGAMRR